MARNELKHPYLHVEWVDREECEGILDGTCYVFPKLDGTNSSVQYYDGALHCFSRTRELSLGTDSSDNAGFMRWACSENEDAVILRTMAEENQNLVFFGEWLTTTKFSRNYLQQRKFYIFDVLDVNVADKYPNLYHRGYLSYSSYKDVLDKYGYPYIIEPLAVVDNPDRACLDSLVESNHFLLPDTIVGEGIAIKRYDYISRFNSYEIAKITRESFRQDKRAKRVFMPGEYEKMFAEQNVTSMLMQKSVDKAKVITGADKLDNKTISMTLSFVWKDCIEEELYTFLKKNRNPTIDFSVLNTLVKDKVRTYLGL